MGFVRRRIEGKKGVDWMAGQVVAGRKLEGHG
jgi:hypothetical protein